jgi:hypothetical protein
VIGENTSITYIFILRDDLGFHFYDNVFFIVMIKES